MGGSLRFGGWPLAAINEPAEIGVLADGYMPWNTYIGYYLDAGDGIRRTYWLSSNQQTCVAVVALAYWWGTRNEPKLPPAPPSGPIALPPSQQGRPMPGGVVSGPIQTTPSPGR